MSSKFQFKTRSKDNKLGNHLRFAQHKLQFWFFLFQLIFVVLVPELSQNSKRPKLDESVQCADCAHETCLTKKTRENKSLSS